MFDNPIDIDNPDYIISLKCLTDPVEIYEFCRVHNISHFGYGFRFVRNSYYITQLKFGYSAPEPGDGRSIVQGERLVRQAAWLPDWNKVTHSSHGYELWHGCKRLIDDGLLPKDATYKDFEIAIWSIDNRTNISRYQLSRKELSEYTESELCEQYIEQHGRLPHLNIANPTRNKTYRLLTKSTFLDLFEIG